MSRIRARFLTLPAAFVAILTMAMLTYPGDLSATYRDFGDYEDNTRELETTRTTNAQLDVNLISLMDRINLKEQWLKELIADRATLRVTMQRFIGLNRSNDVARETIEKQYAGATYEEKAARNVIDFVKTRLATTPGPSNTPQRLQSEFHAMFGTTVAVN